MIDACWGGTGRRPRHQRQDAPVRRFVLRTLAQAIEPVADAAGSGVGELPGRRIVQQRSQRVPLVEVGRGFDDVIASGLALDIHLDIHLDAVSGDCDCRELARDRGSVRYTRFW